MEQAGFPSEGATRAPGSPPELAAAARGARSRLLVLLSVGFVAGLMLRYLAREHATSDAVRYLIPWYRFAHDHGAAGLGQAFTNYTPLYSYLLLAATWFDGLGEPLSLVKAISALFELGCAVVSATIVWRASRSPLRSALAFCGVWLAPTVLFNGAVWGQADSIWTFFILVSVGLFIERRNGVLPFALAFAVKAQAAFLGPFVLGIMIRRRLHWAWLAAVPAVYLFLALPVLAAGRSLASVLEVYLDQAGTFHRLTMNAANLWVFAGGAPYAVGVPLGLGIAAAAGLALAVMLARSRRDDAEFLLLAACASLLLMPYLLPKMHDRYFYAFEVAAIVLACLNPRYLPFAVVAHVDGLLSYLAFERGTVMGVLPAALCNGVLAAYLVADLCRPGCSNRAPTAVWLGFAGSVAGLFAYLLLADPGVSTPPAFLLVSSLTAVMALLLVRGSAPAPSPPGSGLPSWNPVLALRRRSSR